MEENLYYQELKAIIRRPYRTPRERLISCRILLEGICNTDSDSGFSLAAKPSLYYSIEALHKALYLPDDLYKPLHRLRITANKCAHDNFDAKLSDFKKGVKTLNRLIQVVFKTGPDPSIEQWLERPILYGVEGAPLWVNEAEDFQIWSTEHIEARSTEIVPTLEVFGEEIPEAISSVKETHYPETVPQALVLAESSSSYQSQAKHKRYLRVRVSQLATEADNLPMGTFGVVLENDLEEEEWIVELFHQDLNSYLMWFLPMLEVGQVWNLLRPETDHLRMVIVPRQMILEPDILVSVTTIADTFQATHGWNNLVNTLPEWIADLSKTNRAAVKGNIINQFFDWVVSGVIQNQIPAKLADKFSPETWANLPMAQKMEHWFNTEIFAPYALEFIYILKFTTADEFTTFRSEILQQAATIVKVLQSGFIPNNPLSASWQLPINGTSLEANFYSPITGLQGRLDLYGVRYRDGSEAKQARVVELKSGKAPFARPWENHCVQAFAYDILIKAQEDSPLEEIGTYILYASAAPEEALKPADLSINLINSADPNYQNLRAEKAALKREIQEFLVYRSRNNLVWRDLCFTHRFSEEEIRKQLIESWRKIKDGLGGRFAKDTAAQAFSKFEGAEAWPISIQKAWVKWFQFLLKERDLIRRGTEATAITSHAALWLFQPEEKQEQFAYLGNLKWVGQSPAKRSKIEITLERTDQDALVNFRKGDILVLYPQRLHTDPLHKHRRVGEGQLLRVAVEEIDLGKLVVSCRNLLVNNNYLSQVALWAAEPDTMDSAQDKVFQGLTKQLYFSEDELALFYGLKQPHFNKEHSTYLNPALNQNQNQLINNALSSEDYYLISGPPGTGKTRFLLKNYVAEMVLNRRKRILLVAYTNRAVDEICEQLEHIKAKHSQSNFNYIRIGRETSTAENYHDSLLDNQIAKYGNRVSLQRALEECPIYVGTVHAIIGKAFLAEAFRFDAIVIDEASQIVEPLFAQLFNLADTRILIGDEKQLPAVVLQKKEDCEIKDPDLRNDIGLLNLTESWFERILRICKKKGWLQAYGTLTAQGRMHQVLAEFVNQKFYNKRLQLAVPEIQACAWQAKQIAEGNNFQNLLTSSRLVLVETNTSYNTKTEKCHKEEAKLAAHLVWEWLNKEYPKAEQIPANLGEQDVVGVIASFRNQVAEIKQELLSLLPLQPAHLQELINLITVDTVERFQGSQRKMIIISFAVHAAYQIKNISSLDAEETVDRKLNVALSRAREQLIILGVPEALQGGKFHKDLRAWVQQSGKIFQSADLLN